MPEPSDWIIIGATVIFVGQIAWILYLHDKANRDDDNA